MNNDIQGLVVVTAAGQVIKKAWDDVRAMSLDALKREAKTKGETIADAFLVFGNGEAIALAV